MKGIQSIVWRSVFVSCFETEVFLILSYNKKRNTLLHYLIDNKKQIAHSNSIFGPFIDNAPDEGNSQAYVCQKSGKQEYKASN